MTAKLKVKFAAVAKSDQNGRKYASGNTILKNIFEVPFKRPRFFKETGRYVC